MDTSKTGQHMSLKPHQAHALNHPDITTKYYPLPPPATQKYFIRIYGPPIPKSRPSKMVARERFELPSEAPKAPILVH